MHFLLARPSADLVREGFVNSAFAGVRIDGGPDRFSGLRREGKHVPNVARAPKRCDARPVERNIVLAPPSVRYDLCMAAATFKVRPQLTLVRAWCPSVGWKPDFHFAFSFSGYVPALSKSPSGSCRARSCHHYSGSGLGFSPVAA
jgi:hypothetical protein